MNKSKLENGEVIEKEIERIILGYFTSFFDLGEAKSSYNSRTNEYHNNIPLERAVSEMKAFITNALNQQRQELLEEAKEYMFWAENGGGYKDGFKKFLTKLEK